MMYIHGYQSFLWNLVVSKRIQVYGCKVPVVGDVVLVDKEASESEPAVDGDAEDADEENDSNLSEIDKLKKTSKLPAVKSLTEADLSSYSIFDVLMPLPGFIVKYPDGDLGKLYKAMMLADGIDPDDLYRKQS